MYESDFIMRQIRLMTEGLAKMLFQADIQHIELIDEDGNLNGGGILFHRLMVMVGEGRIDKAEDLLFAEIDANPATEFYIVALEFYHRLSELRDDTLAAGNFSRDEVQRGMDDVTAIYDRIAETMPEEDTREIEEALREWAARLTQSESCPFDD